METNSVSNSLPFLSYCDCWNLSRLDPFWWVWAIKSSSEPSKRDHFAIRGNWRASCAHNCYFRPFLPTSVQLLNPKALGELPTGHGALQLSRPKDIGSSCSSPLILFLGLRRHQFHVIHSYRTAFFSVVCLLEILLSGRSIREFCSLSKLERRGQMTPGFAKWLFSIGMATSLVQSLSWQWGPESCICNTFCVWWIFMYWPDC